MPLGRQGLVAVQDTHRSATMTSPDPVTKQELEDFTGKVERHFH